MRDRCQRRSAPPSDQAAELRHQTIVESKRGGSVAASASRAAAATGPVREIAPCGRRPGAMPRRVRLRARPCATRHDPALLPRASRVVVASLVDRGEFARGRAARRRSSTMCGWAKGRRRRPLQPKNKRCDPRGSRRIGTSDVYAFIVAAGASRWRWGRHERPAMGCSGGRAGSRAARVESCAARRAADAETPRGWGRDATTDTRRRDLIWSVGDRRPSAPGYVGSARIGDVRARPPQPFAWARGRSRPRGRWTRSGDRDGELEI